MGNTKNEKQCDIHVVISSIQNRIQQHNVAISLYRETVTININDTSKVKQYADLIRDEEIAIRECQSILEYCL